MFRIVVLTSVLALATASSIRFNRDYDQHWKNFKKIYEKDYNGGQENLRRLLFEQNVDRINQHNLEADLGLHSFRLGLNKYADLDIKELVPGVPISNNINGRIFRLPDSEFLEVDDVDWRSKGVVSPVKDQGQIGQSWAIVAADNVESMAAIAHGQLTSLSVQNLIDCVKSSVPTVNDAFEYMKKEGIDVEGCYKSNGTCNFDKRCIGAKLTGYDVIPIGFESTLALAIKTFGPVSAYIDASHISFQLYSGGIYDEPDCSACCIFDHVVLIVGYGSENGKDFYIVKNSWGTSWGEDGYIKMSRNKLNQCGIASRASYPVVA